MGKKYISVLIVIVLLSGCATAGSDRDRTASEGAAIGTVLGAVTGAAIGYAKDGEEGAVKGAIIGAGVGMIGGALYGNHVANKKEEYASEEEYLDACIASAEHINAETREYNASLKGKVQQLDREVAQLIDEYDNQTIAKADLEEKQQEVLAQKAEADQKLQRVRDEIIIQREVFRREQEEADAKLKELETQIADLESSSTELEQETHTLALLNERLSL